MLHHSTQSRAQSIFTQTVRYGDSILTRDRLIGLGDATAGGADLVPTRLTARFALEERVYGHGGVLVDDQIVGTDDQSARTQVLDFTTESAALGDSLCGALRCERQDDAVLADGSDTSEEASDRNQVGHPFYAIVFGSVAGVASTLKADGEPDLIFQ